jgi:hypothetical protein
MGEAKGGGHRGALFFGLLASSTELIERICSRLQLDYSPIAVRSELIPFTHTTYYQTEMGAGLVRQWIATRDPIFLEELASIKLATNRLEKLYGQPGGRRVNVDPGYLTMSKVVLATTKDYEEVTLHYRRGSGFEAWPWTYPDYRDEPARRFFTELRERLASELRM